MHSARAARPSHRPPRRRVGDPDCPTCHGSGLFIPIGKAHEVAVACPRCLGGPSVHAVPPLQAAR